MKSKLKQPVQYTTRLKQGEKPEVIFNDLTNFLRAAEVYADRNCYQQALEIYAQVIDAHLATKEELLVSLFDRAITEFLSQLDILLVGASSLIISKPYEGSSLSKLPDALTPISSPSSISPFLTPEARHRWLERLFTLWLKRIDLPQISESLQEIIFEVVWSEDIPYLRNLVESALQPPSADSQRHVESFADRSHIRALQQLLKHLPQ